MSSTWRGKKLKNPQRKVHHGWRRVHRARKVEHMCDSIACNLKANVTKKSIWLEWKSCRLFIARLESVWLKSFFLLKTATILTTSPKRHQSLLVFQLALRCRKKISISWSNLDQHLVKRGKRSEMLKSFLWIPWLRTSAFLSLHHWWFHMINDFFVFFVLSFTYSFFMVCCVSYPSHISGPLRTMVEGDTNSKFHEIKDSLFITWCHQTEQ